MKIRLLLLHILKNKYAKSKYLNRSKLPQKYKLKINFSDTEENNKRNREIRIKVMKLNHK